MRRYYNAINRPTKPSGSWFWNFLRWDTGAKTNRILHKMRIQNHSLPSSGLFLVALFAPFSARAQSTAPIPRLELRGSEKIAVPNRFATGGVDPIRCDRQGNIYMRPVSGMETSLSGPILKILSDG